MAGTESCGEEGTGAQATVLHRRRTKGLSWSQEAWDLGHISQPNYRSRDYEKCVCPQALLGTRLFQASRQHVHCRLP